MANPDPTYVTVKMPLASALIVHNLIRRRIDELNQLIKDDFIPPQDHVINCYTEGMKAISEVLPKYLVK